MLMAGFELRPYLRDAEKERGTRTEEQTFSIYISLISSNCRFVVLLRQEHWRLLYVSARIISDGHVSLLATICEQSGGFVSGSFFNRRTGCKWKAMFTHAVHRKRRFVTSDVATVKTFC